MDPTRRKRRTVKIGLVHYSGPPTVGGVEQTLYYHARALADHGYQPQLLVGAGTSFDPRVEVEVIPRLGSRHPEVLAVKAELDRGEVSGRFKELQARITDHLSEHIASIEILIVHNALTLHKNLALTAALWELHQSARLPALIGWHHDFAWDRPGYRDELHPGYPWELLRTPWPNTSNVVVSAAQQRRLANLYRLPLGLIGVVPPGFDPAVTGNWTDLARCIVEELRLMTADVILLLPARITRRKNIEFGARILAALRRASGKDARLIVTGPPGPHNPTNVAYLQELLDLVQALGVGNAVHFLYQLGGEDPLIVDDATMANLYGLCDALLFPSRDEGFGIPILEAAFTRLPVFCSDIPPFHESGGEEVHYFSLSSTPEAVAEQVAENLFAQPPFVIRQRVRKGYTWERIVTAKMLPLFEGIRDAS